MTASILIACVAPSTHGEMRINGVPLMQIGQEAANQSWDAFNRRLAEKPYNPGTFAWGLSYAMRAYVRLYQFTGNRMWLDRAINWTEYLINFSDVNGDGEPAWGNYNETWGTSRYDYVEFTVHDGMICVPIVELAQAILSDPELRGEPEMYARAQRYIGLVKAIVDRHHRYWSDVDEESGYYWNDPTNPDLVIVNRFAALGNAEILLSDLLQDPSYLDKPRRMANLIKKNLKYDPRDDCYLWTYAIGGSGIEDTSHGCIDLEFMFLCYQHGLVFNHTDMERLANTYEKRMWQGIEMFRTGVGISTRIDGTVDPDNDYTRVSAAWPLLSLIRPRILQEHRAALETYDRSKGLPRDRVMAWMMARMMELEAILLDQGIDVESIRPFSAEMVLPEIDALSDLLEGAEEVGANVTEYRELVQALYANCQEMVESNVSHLLYLVWSAQENLTRIRAEAYISQAEEVIAQARSLGIDTSREELFLGRAKLSLSQGFYESAENMCKQVLRLQEQLAEKSATASLALAALLLFTAAEVRRSRSSELGARNI